MAKRRFSRAFLMIAGIATVVVILLSQSFYQPANKAGSAAKKDQKEQTSKYVSAAPSEVVTSPAVQLDKVTTYLLSFFDFEDQPETDSVPVSQIVVSFFKTLLRATISPNAP